MSNQDQTDAVRVLRELETELRQRASRESLSADRSKEDSYIQGEYIGASSAYGIAATKIAAVLPVLEQQQEQGCDMIICPFEERAKRAEQQLAEAEATRQHEAACAEKRQADLCESHEEQFRRAEAAEAKLQEAEATRRSLEATIRAQRLDAALSMMEGLQKHGIWLHDDNGNLLDKDAFMAAIAAGLAESDTERARKP